MPTARDERDLVAGEMQPGAENAADRSRTVDDEAHGDYPKVG
jgi:hypothetical protein